MAPTSDHAARHLQRLAVLVAQRRAQLGLKKQEAAAVCDIAYMTYWKIEDGQSVRASTYSKLEVGFNMRAGSCKAVLDGAADSVVLEDGTELIEGGQVARFDAGALSEGLPDAVTKTAMLVAPELTGRQIRELNEQLMEELRRRGLMPQAPDQG
jgi:DNA-binding XRE family transcriptional regulator